MKKIITALADPKLSLKIKEECNTEIISPDIQYQEGVLEILENNKNAEILILNSLLEGNLNIFDFINKIKEKNNEIKIIIILEEKDIELENFLNAKNIVDIFYNNKNTINELIKKINEVKTLKKINKNNLEKNEEEINEEIKILKELLQKNNKNKLLNKNTNNIFIKIKNKIKQKEKFKIFNKSKKRITKNKNNNSIFFNNNVNNIDENKTNNNLICVIGSSGVGKSIFCCIISKILNSNNKKILIIDFNNLNSNINSIFGIKKDKKESTKINKNIDLITVKNTKRSKKDIVGKYCKKYDLVIIDLNPENIEEQAKEVFLSSNIIIVICEANLIGIEKSRNLINNYLNKIPKEKINILFNKINFNSIDQKILNNIFSEFNILGKIKLNKNYDLAINSNLKIINKKIKKDYLKISNKIINQIN